MLRRLMTWLYGAPPAPIAPEQRSTMDDGPCDVPPGAHALAYQIMHAMLKVAGAEKRSVDVEAMTIAPYRILVQMLPFRVYVYVLGSVMGDMEFEAIVRSQRPRRSVFDVFEIDIDGVRCGFYVYSLQPFADGDLFNQLSLEVRRAAGAARRAVPLAEVGETSEAATHDAQEENSEAEPAFETVSLEGDPDVIAERLIASTLWRTPLDEVDLSTEKGQGDLLARFMIREGKASMEKDELIRFVEKNRSALPDFLENVLGAFAEAAKGVEGGESIAAVTRHFQEQANHAYRGERDKIQTRSDRLFWLMYVLAAQLAEQRLSYETGVGYLKRSPHRDRITSSGLLFIVNDYIESMEQVNRPPTEMLMLVGEAACIVGDEAIARGALKVVLRIGTAGNAGNLLQYVSRMERYLGDCGGLDEDERNLVRRVNARYGAAIGPDDF